MDLGELYQFEQAQELSMDLLVQWLSKYKFKDWTKTETRGLPVDEVMKTARAREVAGLLSQNDYWHSHGRGINMKVLRDIIKIKVEDYSAQSDVAKLIRDYFELMRDYMLREQMLSFVHTREFF
jgi:hypothetical protein